MSISNPKSTPITVYSKDKYCYISEFSFEIIEHCEPSILIEREQYYIYLIYPEYNILKFAGNRQGFIHSEATKELQRNARLGTVYPKELN